MSYTPEAREDPPSPELTDLVAQLEREFQALKAYLDEVERRLVAGGL